MLKRSVEMRISTIGIVSSPGSRYPPHGYLRYPSTKATSS